MAPSPSGKARVCKTLIPSSNLGGASNRKVLQKLPLSDCFEGKRNNQSKTKLDNLKAKVYN